MKLIEVQLNAQDSEHLEETNVSGCYLQLLSEAYLNAARSEYIVIMFSDLVVDAVITTAGDVHDVANLDRKHLDPNISRIISSERD